MDALIQFLKGDFGVICVTAGFIAIGIVMVITMLFPPRKE